MNAANAPLHASALENQRRAHEPSMEEILASIRKIIADDDELPLSRPMTEARAKFGATPRPFETNVTPLTPPVHEPALALALDAEPEPDVAHAAEDSYATEPAQAPSLSIVADSHEADEPPMELVADVPAPVASPPPALDAADLASFAEIAQELAAEDEPVPQAAPIERVVDAPAPDLRPSLATVAEFGRTSSFDPTPDVAPNALDCDLNSHMGAMLSAEANASISSAFQALSASVQMTSAETIERHVRELLRPMLKQWLDDNLPVMVERMVRAEIERVARGAR